MSKNKISYVKLDGSIFRFQKKMNWAAFRRFWQLFNPIQHKLSDITLDLTKVIWAYPNGIVPLIAVLEKFSGSGNTIHIIEPKDQNLHSFFKNNGWYFFLNQVEYPNNSNTRTFALRKFHNDEELNSTTSSLLDWVLQSTTLAEGIPQTFEWTINELAGNILVHAEANHGWIQVAFYPNNTTLSIVICDTGIGIHRSMRAAFPDITTDLEALQKALEKEVTSKPEFGQGNGLSGSVALTHENRGASFLIASGGSQLEIYNNHIRPSDLSPSFPGTIIDLQLNTTRKISLSKALWGHEPISSFELKFENEQGNLDLKLRDYATSFGNRITGQKIRHLLENMLRNYPDSHVSVNFDGVSLISSSFADELFGKIAVNMGVLQFGRKIKLVNINDICYTIIERIVEQRISYKYSKSIDEVEFGEDDNSLDKK